MPRTPPGKDVLWVPAASLSLKFGCDEITIWRVAGLLLSELSACGLLLGNKKKTERKVAQRPFDNAHKIAFCSGEQGVPTFNEVLHQILRAVSQI